MAESEKLMTVNIVTPDGLIYSHKSSIVVMRAVDGERAVMYNHTPFLTPLAIGDVRVKRSKENNQHVDHIAVNGGYIDFANNVATIIADSAERARNIDLSRAEAAKERAEKHLEEAKASHNQSSYERASVALRRAVNRINVHRDAEK
ncbi:F0F1 ATP synthase subunit epsilon [Lactobacillus psittaci]|uniref:ATP synthase epsilon chain n=1 Tax=Lactobacillus psittaci DSM 15354 TaxID=1122152 RepID=A0A0R1SBD6_9LACO|nr:F0F1 ATP synthase subunit epsilon [Lactobacillus psittaci]KRL63443.1 ATP synthase F1, epsilon subunit [Lactobacillus psittaci DSM 15354]